MRNPNWEPLVTVAYYILLDFPLHSLLVLSAGYDGDENREEETRRRFRDSTAFDETPLVLPEVVQQA